MYGWLFLALEQYVKSVPSAGSRNDDSSALDNWRNIRSTAVMETFSSVSCSTEQSYNGHFRANVVGGNADRSSKVEESNRRNDSDAWLIDEDYPDHEFFGLINATATVLNMSSEDVLERLGRFFLEFTRSRGYDQVYRSLGSSLKEWLNNVNEMHMHIHFTLAEEHQNRAHVRDGVEMKLPAFPEIFCRDDDSIDDCSKYSSNRGGSSSGAVTVVEAELNGNDSALSLCRSYSAHDHNNSKRRHIGKVGKNEVEEDTLSAVTSSFILMYRSSRGTNLASFLMGLVREAAMAYFCSEIIVFDRLSTQGQDGAAHTTWRVKVRQLPPSPIMSPPPDKQLLQGLGSGFPSANHLQQLQSQGLDVTRLQAPGKEHDSEHVGEGQQQGKPSPSSCPFAHALLAHQERPAAANSSSSSPVTVTNGVREMGMASGIRRDILHVSSTSSYGHISSSAVSGGQDVATTTTRGARNNCSGGTSSGGVGLTEAQLMSAFPFHIVLDRDIQIKQLGSGYRKLNRCAPALHLLSTSLSMITAPSIVSDFFNIVQPPSCTWSVKDLRDWKDSEFVLETKGSDTFDTPFRLTGSLLLGEDGGSSTSGGSGGASFIFLVQPDINSLDDMCNLDLTWSDFPKHSSQKKVVYMSEHLKSETYLSRKSRTDANNTQHLLEMKRTFVRYVSHEIRTPLNTVAMGLRLIHKIMQDDEQEKKRGDDAKKSHPPPLAALVEVTEEEEIVAGENQHTLERCSAGGRGESTNKPTSPAEKENPVEMVGEIMESCDIAVNILNDLLLFEKIDGGMLEMQTKEEPALLMVYEAVRVYSMHARQLGVDLDCTFDEECFPLTELEAPTIFVDVDQVKISQVLRNLVSNAIKMATQDGGDDEVHQSTAIERSSSSSSPDMPLRSLSPRPEKKTVTVHVSVRREEIEGASSNCASVSPMLASNFYAGRSPASYSRKGSDPAAIKLGGAPRTILGKPILRIEVRDSGPGMSEENRQHFNAQILEFDIQKLQGGQGSGLGLYISKGIVDLHKGKIGILGSGSGEGNPGQGAAGGGESGGSCLFIDLPVSRQNGRRLSAVLESRKQSGNRTHSIFSLGEMAGYGSSARRSVTNIAHSPPQLVDFHSKFRRGDLSPPSIDTLKHHLRSAGFMSRLLEDVRATDSPLTVMDACFPLGARRNTGIITDRDDDVVSILRSRKSSSVPDALGNRSGFSSPGFSASSSAATVLLKKIENEGLRSSPLGIFENVPEVAHESESLVKSSSNLPARQSPLSQLATPQPQNSQYSASYSEIKAVAAAAANSLGPSASAKMLRPSNSKGSSGDLTSEVTDSTPKTVVSLLKGPAGTSTASAVITRRTSRTVTPLASIDDLPKLNVLIVDDSMGTRKMISRCLRMHKISDIAPIEAEDGAQALRTVCASMGVDVPYYLGKDESSVAKAPPSFGEGVVIDLILMDFVMPVMDGPTATKLIRGMGYEGLIVGVTGNVLQDDQVLFIEHGANAVLTKPLDVGLLTTFLTDRTALIQEHRHRSLVSASGVDEENDNIDELGYDFNDNLDSLGTSAVVSTRSRWKPRDSVIPDVDEALLVSSSAPISQQSSSGHSLANNKFSPCVVSESAFTPAPICVTEMTAEQVKKDRFEYLGTRHQDKATPIDLAVQATAAASAARKKVQAFILSEPVPPEFSAHSSQAGAEADNHRRSCDDVHDIKSPEIRGSTAAVTPAAGALDQFFADEETKKLLTLSALSSVQPRTNVRASDKGLRSTGSKIPNAYGTDDHCFSPREEYENALSTPCSAVGATAVLGLTSAGIGCASASRELASEGVALHRRHGGPPQQESATDDSSKGRKSPLSKVVSMVLRVTGLRRMFFGSRSVNVSGGPSNIQRGASSMETSIHKHGASHISATTRHTPSAILPVSVALQGGGEIIVNNRESVAGGGAHTSGGRMVGGNHRIHPLPLMLPNPQ